MTKFRGLYTDLISPHVKWRSAEVSLPDDFTFSQSALQDYLACQRRFELRFVKDLQWPALETESALKHESYMLKGQEFHHLVHQHTLGIPGQAIEATITDDDLRAWWGNYLRWQATRTTVARYAELTLTTPIAGFILTAKYDVVAKMPDSGFLIIDWKTGRPQNRSSLATRMQTIVYPYVLSRAGDWLNQDAPIPAERIRMTYWFADDASTVDFTIDDETLKRSEEQLHSIIENISTQFDFPMTDNKRLCEFCEYRSFCDRGIKAGNLEDLAEDRELTDVVSLDLDEIEEISF